MEPIFCVFGLFVPFIEIWIGVGLITQKYRTKAIWLAFAMCFFVLLTIGPLGHNWNSVVWPWNVMMAISVFVLFVDTEAILPRDILWVKNFFFHKIVLIMFGILPLFSFFNLWDSYLSWSLYSGAINDAALYINDRVKDRLPPYVR
ncbi:MAG TPA: hypothetical protein PKD37_03570 [Oligoflexia bacterium]|nr:hypothetical protein [Oligoflexia bacterium]HMP27048.1 hypothetical protein [Oligoflexia bacterium]